MVTIQPVKMLMTGGWPGCFWLEFFGENGSWLTYTILTRILYLSVGYLGMYLDTPPTNWAAIREKNQNWPSGPVVGANVFIRQKTAKRTEEPSVPMPKISSWYFHDISVIPNLHILMIFGRLGGSSDPQVTRPGVGRDFPRSGWWSLWWGMVLNSPRMGLHSGYLT